MHRIGSLVLVIAAVSGAGCGEPDDGASGPDGREACAGVDACAPVAELCGNGLDDDGDGVADDGCLCEPGAVSACYFGPPGTEGVGACAAGTRVCDASGAAYGPCTGYTFPRPEVCGDAVDDDCDGSAAAVCIGDRAWHDLDRDGVQDAGEPGLAGATFRLRTSAGALVRTATSDGDGRYVFDDVGAGTYFLDVVAPPGFSSVGTDRADDTRDNDFDDELRTPAFGFSGGASIDDIDAGFAANVQS